MHMCRSSCRSPAPHPHHIVCFLLDPKNLTPHPRLLDAPGRASAAMNSHWPTLKMPWRRGPDFTEQCVVDPRSARWLDDRSALGSDRVFMLRVLSRWPSGNVMVAVVVVAVVMVAQTQNTFWKFGCWVGIHTFQCGHLMGPHLCVQPLDPRWP